MNNKVKDAFEPIRATGEMKRSTTDFLHREIARRQHKLYKLPSYALICSVVLLLFVCTIGRYKAYQTPVSYISVDVNPSVELGLNSLDRVVTVTAYNDDGAVLLSNLDLKHKTYTQAVELLLADELFESYLTGDSLLSFTVVSEKEDTLLAGIRQCRGYAENKAECSGASAELMNAARRSGLSFGKYQAFVELSQYDNTITIQDCKKLSMWEIRDLIRQYTGSEDDTNAPTGNGHHGAGQGKGQGRGYRGGRGY